MAPQDPNYQVEFERARLVPSAVEQSTLPYMLAALAPIASALSFSLSEQQKATISEWLLCEAIARPTPIYFDGIPAAVKLGVPLPADQVWDALRDGVAAGTDNDIECALVVHEAGVPLPQDALKAGVLESLRIRRTLDHRRLPTIFSVEGLAVESVCPALAGRRKYHTGLADLLLARDPKVAERLLYAAGEGFSLTALAQLLPHLEKVADPVRAARIAERAFDEDFAYCGID